MKNYLFLFLIFCACSLSLQAQQSDYPSNNPPVKLLNSPKLVRVYFKVLNLTVTYVQNDRDTIIKDVSYKKNSLKATIVMRDNYGSAVATLSNGDIINFVGNKRNFRLMPITLVNETGKIKVKKVKEYLPQIK